MYFCLISNTFFDPDFSLVVEYGLYVLVIWEETHVPQWGYKGLMMNT